MQHAPLTALAFVFCGAGLSNAPPPPRDSDAQCNVVAGVHGTHGWRKNESHATSSCNMPVLNVGSDGLSLGAIARHCAQATTPLLIRGLLDEPGWRELFEEFGNRTKLVGSFGHEKVRLSLAALLNQGPEARSQELDAKKLAFMKNAWAAGGDSVFRRSLQQQVQAGEARPWATLGDFVAALGEDDVPIGSYVFHNVSGSVALVESLERLRKLWGDITLAQFSLEQRSPRVGPALPDVLMRLGVGGSGSGTGFHDHELALNLAFAGRKRWLVIRPGKSRVPGFSPDELLHRALPSVAFQDSWRQLGDRGETWDCTQQAGEMVFVPETFLHATVNLDESLSVAVQCENTDPRNGLSALNALIVHASEGAESAFGPCGTRWASPWQGLDVDQALSHALPELLRRQPVDLNVPDTDGHTPIDAAIWFGSVRVAEALALHGARFLPRHLMDARTHGHEQLAEFIGMKAETG